MPQYEANTVLSTQDYKVVGTRPVRHDGADKVTGRAQYSADTHLPGLLHARVLRSPHAHARIKSIDTTQARSLPGVKAVITAADFAQLPSTGADQGFYFTCCNVMAKDKVLYKGHAVAAVAAGEAGLEDFAAGRRAAADAVFKSRALSALPVLEQAIEREQVAKVKERLVMARAAIALDKSKIEAERLAAITTLSTFAVPEVRSLLGSIANSKASQAVRDAAAEALIDIESRLAFWNGVGTIFQGISLGSVLLLAAVGLAITFGVMGVINMAHGELVMIGAYTTFMVQEVFRNYFPEAFDFSILVAIPAAFLVAGAFGIAIERGVIRYLYGRPLETLLATWGLSLILQQLMRTVFGPTNQEVGSPSWMSGAVEVTGGLVLTFNRMWIIAFSLMVLLSLVIVLKKTAFGLQMRAVTQNRAMASSMGIRTGLIDALTFGLGSGIAGMAGVAISQIDNVSPNLGQNYIIDSFMVVVFGGVGNLWGTLVGAFSLGIVNKFMEPFTGTVLAKIFVLVAIILFIQKRPRGLFALKGRAVEN